MFIKFTTTKSARVTSSVSYLCAAKKSADRMIRSANPSDYHHGSKNVIMDKPKVKRRNGIEYLDL